MTETIDVNDLHEEQIKFIQDLVEFLREKGKREKAMVKEAENIAFNAWPLGVRGNLTREEIYDYL